RRRRTQRRDVVGVGVHGGDEVTDVCEVPERLDAAGGGAGADGDESLRRAADLVDALGGVWRRDRSLDENEVVRAFHGRTGRLEEVGDLDRARDCEELVLAVEQRQLAAVARRELPDGELRLLLRHSSGTSSSGASSSQR